MKRTIVIIFITSVTLLVAGILYGSHSNIDYVKTLTLEEAYIAQFPEQLPDVVIEPMNSFPIY